ncbi:MAG: cytochrome c [Leptolyngbya sp. SIO1D8]|nr:cytochrome c [Leptolyngbya sp. SIO1D8]
MLVGVHHIQAADPYIQAVLTLEGHKERGQGIFQMNCAVCHGIEAQGEVGPSLLGVSARKSKAKLIRQVVSGETPPMPQFQPDPQDMADLLQYLETL